MKSEPVASQPRLLPSEFQGWQLEIAFISGWSRGSWVHILAFVLPVTEDSAQLFFLSLEQTVSEYLKARHVIFGANGHTLEWVSNGS